MLGSGLGRRFWLLWSATTVANIGDGISLTAFPLLAIHLTDDARLVALVTAFRVLPFLIVGLPAGVLLDRLDRRRIGVVAQVGRGVPVAVMAALVAADQASMGLLIGAAFVVGVGEVFTDGGLPAMVRSVVRSDQLEVANSRLLASQTVNNMFIGPPLGALLFELDRSLPFFAIAVGVGVGAVLLAALPGSFRPEITDTEDAPFRSQLLTGLLYVWSHPVLRPLALSVALFAFMGEATNAVLVILVTERFGFGSVGFGALMSLDAVTSLVMSFFVARLVARWGHANSMRIAVVAFSVASLLLGFTTVAVGAVLASLINGAGDPTWNVVSSTIRQRLVPDQIFGRMMTAYLFIAWGIQPIGALLGGVIAEAYGAQWVYVMAACGVSSLLIVARPMFAEVTRAMSSP
ncbi:MAG: MFS transporter [Actinomycetia bacterium]|nr:MFS transporter [Actinomycetes bacterium]MCP4085751.1 MFS transporter [Actinomycetes bacterium]